MSSDLERSKELEKARIMSSTAAGYRNKVKQACKYWSNSSRYKGDAVRFDGEGLPVLPIPSAALASFFGHLCKSPAYKQAHAEEEAAEEDGPAEEDDDGEAPTQGPKKRAKTNDWYAASYVAAYKSAIKWWYLEKKVKWLDEDETSLSNVITGYEKEIATAKNKGELKQKSGKTNLKFSGYEMLAKKMMSHTPTSTTTTDAQGKSRATHAGSWAMATMGWLFHLLCWNLIARSATVDVVNSAHLGWTGDHATAFIGASKKDKKGTEKVGARSLFANPLNPAICVVLAFAVHFFSWPPPPPPRPRCRRFSVSCGRTRVSTPRSRLCTPFQRTSASRPRRSLTRSCFGSTATWARRSVPTSSFVRGTWTPRRRTPCARASRLL